jgi:Fe-S oxidoreductase
MEHNVEMIKKSGAKKVVFTCPECFRTFDMDYKSLMGDLPFEAVHISDYVQELVASGALKLDGKAKAGAKFTYHDSCRLGRHSGVYDSPRKLAEAFTGETFVEMENTRDKAICCGVSAWTNCNSGIKKMQVERIMEAKRVGADRLLMFCPKCQIHFRCAVQDKVPVDKALVDVELEDFTVALARLMGLIDDKGEAK